MTCQNLKISQTGIRPTTERTDGINILIKEKNLLKNTYPCSQRKIDKLVQKISEHLHKIRTTTQINSLQSSQRQHPTRVP